MRRRYGWFAALTQSAVFVTFAAVGIFALYFVRKRRDRAKLARLKASEPPDEPAYWTDTETEPGTSGGDADADRK